MKIEKKNKKKTLLYYRNCLVVWVGAMFGRKSNFRIKIWEQNRNKKDKRTTKTRLYSFDHFNPTFIQ